MDKPTNSEGKTKKQKTHTDEAESLEEAMVKTQSIFNNKNPKLHLFEPKLWMDGGDPKRLRVKRNAARKINFHELGYDTHKRMKGLSYQTFTRNLTVGCTEYEEITEEALSHLSRSLKSLHRLQILNLFLSSGDIEAGALSHLSRSFRSLPSLKSLTLDFNRCENLVNEALSHLNLKHGFRALQSLLNLTLDFGFCDKLTDEAFTHLSQGFKSLSSLKSLTLNFDQCENITEEGLHHLSQGFISLPSLQNLSLYFEYLETITERGLSNLSQGFISLPSLQNLTLDFENCKTITEKGLSNLSQDIRSLPSLQSLTLDLTGAVLDEVKESLEKDLEYHNNSLEIDIR